MAQLQDSSIRVVMAALHDLKMHPEFSNLAKRNESDAFANMSVEQRETFFRLLLEKLHSSLCGTCHPSSSSAKTAAGSGAMFDGKFCSFLQSVSVVSGSSQQQQAALKVNQSTQQTQTGDDNGSAPGYQPSVFFHQRSRMPVSAQMVEKIKNGIIENNIFKVYLLNTFSSPAQNFTQIIFTFIRYVPRCVHGALLLPTSKAFKIAAKLNKNSK